MADITILNDIKKTLGIDSAYTHFDSDILMFINAALLTVNQIGIGTGAGFNVVSTDIWTVVLGARTDINAVKTLIYLKVKLLFDPPSSSFVVDAVERQINELTYRLNVQSD